MYAFSYMQNQDLFGYLEMFYQYHAIDIMVVPVWI